MCQNAGSEQPVQHAVNLMKGLKDCSNLCNILQQLSSCCSQHKSAITLFTSSKTSNAAAVKLVLEALPYLDDSSKVAEMFKAHVAEMS